MTAYFSHGFVGIRPTSACQTATGLLGESPLVVFSGCKGIFAIIPVMSVKHERISLVIPVFNEADQLVACLSSVMAQRRPFDEIIVVDNNSTDDSIAIAKGFPGVTVIHEARQGVVYARERGFNTATGDIIARIDGDTRLPHDWTQELLQVFDDKSLAATSGKIAYYNMAGHELVDFADVVVRRFLRRVLGSQMFMQAANMAMRRDVWQAVRPYVCRRGGVHEDFDLSLHVQQLGYRVTFDERLRAGIDLRQLGGGFSTFANYFWHCPKTYMQHKAWRGIFIYPIILIVIVSFPILKLLHRGYDAHKRRFSMRKLLQGNSSIRVNPATYVD